MKARTALNTLVYDPARCTGCGLCVQVCPHGVFAMPEAATLPPGLKLAGSRRHAALLVRAEACMECGACQLNCPAGAITVDSGVGCAEAMIRAALTRRQVSCGPGPRCEAEC